MVNLISCILNGQLEKAKEIFRQNVQNKIDQRIEVEKQELSKKLFKKPMYEMDDKDFRKSNNIDDRREDGDHDTNRIGSGFEALGVSDTSGTQNKKTIYDVNRVKKGDKLNEGRVKNPMHKKLIATGWKHTHIPADWEEDGDPENGPKLTGYGAFHMYTKHGENKTHYIDAETGEHNVEKNLKLPRGMRSDTKPIPKAEKEYYKEINAGANSYDHFSESHTKEQLDDRKKHHENLAKIYKSAVGDLSDMGYNSLSKGDIENYKTYIDKAKLADHRAKRHTLANNVAKKMMESDKLNEQLYLKKIFK